MEPVKATMNTLNVTIDLGDYRVVEVSQRGIVIQIARNVHITIEPLHLKGLVEIAEGETLKLYTKLKVRAQ